METGILLGIDTCGAMGSIALSRLQNGALELLGEKAIPGGELSVFLVQGIADLWQERRQQPDQRQE